MRTRRRITQKWFNEQPELMSEEKMLAWASMDGLQRYLDSNTMKNLHLQMPDHAAASIDLLGKDLGSPEPTYTIRAALALLNMTNDILKHGGRLTFVHNNGTSQEMTLDEIRGAISKFSANKLTNG